MNLLDYLRSWLPGRRGDKDPKLCLIRALGERDPQVRKSAAQKLAEMGETKWLTPYTGGKTEDVVHYHELAMKDPRAVIPLIRFLENGEDFQRQMAADAIGALERHGFLKDKRSVIGPLIEALGRAEKVQDAAVAALFELKPSTDLTRKPLVKLLQNESASVRCGAIRAIVATGLVDQLCGMVISALRDPKDIVRAAAAQALGRLQLKDNLSAATEALTLARRDDIYVRSKVEKSLDSLRRRFSAE